MIAGNDRFAFPRRTMLSRIRRAGSLIELLIVLVIIGGLASLILTAAMMLLRAAYRIGA
jgi:prepilin-type N-terminal cleavage/methylation domain-containing protein